MKLNEPQLLYLAFQAKQHSSKYGYLLKKSGKKNIPDVRWQRRWCTIYCNMFFYYEHADSTKPQGVIFLEGIQSFPTEVNDGKNYHCFTVGVPGDDHRQYLFACDKSQTCDEWVQAITSSSVERLIQQNSNLSNNIKSLESNIQTLKDEKAKLNKEISNQCSQITRLKLEVNKLRNQAGNNRESLLLTRSLSNSVKSESSSSVPPFDHVNGGTGDYSPDDISKLVKLQSYIRMWFQRKRWNYLVKPYIKKYTADTVLKRNKLLFQLFTAEKDYVQQMQTLVNSFLIPMKSLSYFETSCLKSAEVNSIFGSSELILVLHQSFHDAMEKRMKQWPAVQIDDFLFTILTAAPFYIEYIKNHPTALKTLAECKKRSSFVKQLVTYEKCSECHGQTLEQFLYHPIRQIPDYIRHIHAILEETPDGHPEKETLNKIIDKFQEAQSYNYYLDECESIRHTLMIERLIEGGCPLLLTADQKFVRHGVLKQIAIQSRSEKKETLRYCFLFTQHMLICARTDGRRLRLSRQYGVIPLNNTTLVEDILESSNYPEHIKNLAFTLHIRSPDGRQELFSIALRASDSHEKALWTTDINQCIYNLDWEACEYCRTSDSNHASHVANHEPTDRDNMVHSLKQPQPPFTYGISLMDDPRLREDDHDIKYGEEVAEPCALPQILYASVDRLLERLSDPRLPGAEFMETFLLTYRVFTDSKVVMQGLIDAYWRVMGGRHVTDVTELDSAEKSKPTVNGRTLNPNHIRSIISGSSMSSVDDLESSFNSCMFPHSSTTVFNYNIMKEQLSLPRKRSVATTKWCQDTFIISRDDNRPLRKPRSISACDTRNDCGTDTYIRTMRCNEVMSRSQSVDIIVNGSYPNRNNVFLPNHQSHPYQTNNRHNTLSSRRRSVDDDLHDERHSYHNSQSPTPRFYSISQTEICGSITGTVKTRSSPDDEPKIAEYCKQRRSSSLIINASNKYDWNGSGGGESTSPPSSLFDRTSENIPTIQERTSCESINSIFGRSLEKNPILASYSSSNRTKSDIQQRFSPPKLEESNGTVKLIFDTNDQTSNIVIDRTKISPIHITERNFHVGGPPKTSVLENATSSKPIFTTRTRIEQTSFASVDDANFSLRDTMEFSSNIEKPVFEMGNTNIESESGISRNKCLNVDNTTVSDNNSNNIQAIKPTFGRRVSEITGRDKESFYSGMCGPLTDISPTIVSDLRYGAEDEHTTEDEISLDESRKSISEDAEDTKPSYRRRRRTGNVNYERNGGFGCTSPFLLMSVPGSADSTQPSDEHNNSVSSNHSSLPNEEELDHSMHLEEENVTSAIDLETIRSPAFTANSYVVPHSQSVDIICDSSVCDEDTESLYATTNSRCNSDESRQIKKCASLDQRKVSNNTSYGNMKRKGAKKPNARSVSEPNTDVAVLLNVKERRCSTTVMERSSSVNEGSTKRNDHQGNDEYKKSMPISIPGGKLKKNETSARRKRSIFSKSFLKGSLKRSSSEQVLTYGESIKNQHLRTSASTLNLSDNNSSSSVANAKNKSASLPHSKALHHSSSTDKLKLSSTKNNNVIRRYHKYNKENRSAPSSSGKSGNELMKKSPLSPAVDFFSDIFSSRKKNKDKNTKDEADDISITKENNVDKRISVIESPVKTSSTPPFQQPVFAKNRGPLKIMNIFKHWVAKHPKDYIEDPELLDMMEAFFVDIKNDVRTVPVVKDIVKNLERLISAQRTSILQSLHTLEEFLLSQSFTPGDIEEVKNLKNMKPLHHFDHIVVGDNMTLLEHFLFAKISFNEFISCPWMKKDKDTKAPGIMRFINHFNKVTYMIKYDVVFGSTCSSRARTIDFWIQVAQYCHKHNNFNSTMEIVSALNASSVHRLKKSWELVPKASRDAFAGLHTLVSAERSFKNLREAVHMCNPPCVPYLGCYLSDLVFVHGGGATYNKDSLINFGKMFKIARLVREVGSYQQLPYTLDLNSEVVSALLKHEKTGNDDLLYDQSLLAEPRES